MQTAAKLLLGKDAIKLSSDWGPANLNLSLDVVDIFANNYNIFEPEVRRGVLLRAVFHPRAEFPPPSKEIVLENVDDEFKRF